MSSMKIGDTAPDFTLPADDGHDLTLSRFRGRKVVLYFYPKDDTSGCTAESCAFRDHKKDFEKLDAQVIGISKDNVASHKKFKAKYDLNFPLVSDEKVEACEAYGVWIEKSMYGRKYMGIDRSTFLIDEQGKIAAVWRKVKVTGHVEEVAAALKELKKAA